MRFNSIEQADKFLKANGVFLFVEENKLGIKKKNAYSIPDDILTYLKSNKREVIHYINDKKSFNKIKSAGDYGLPKEITNAKLSRFANDAVHGQRTITDICLLTPLQKGFAFHHLHDKEAYLSQMNFEIKGPFSRAVFRQTWRYLIQQHSILRTAFFINNLELPVQCVYDTVELPIEEVDFSKVEKENLEEHFNNFLKQDRDRGFNLSEAPLMRISLVDLGNDTIRMVVTNHHIVLDGWSVGQLQKEFLHCYLSLEEKSILPQLPYDNFGDYVRSLNKKGVNEGLMYWEKHLSNINKPSYLPFIKDETKRNLVFGNKKLEFFTDLDIDTYVRKHKITKNTLAQGIWSFLLSEYTGENDVVFGNVISGRGDSENADRQVGMFINTIPLSTSINRESKVADWLQTLQNEHTSGREEYGHLPLSEIESKSVLKRGLFDTIMAVMNFTKPEVTSTLNSKLQIEGSEGFEVTNYILSVKISPFDQTLKFQLIYNDQLISDSIILMIKDHIINAFKSVVQGAEYVKDITYLTQEDHSKLLLFSKGEEIEYARNTNLIDAFSSQVDRYPDRLAVSYEGKTLSYAELDTRSNQLANYLRTQGIQSGNFVGLMLDRSLDMIVGILGILKSGAGYLPIDPNLPEERVKYMLDQSGTTLLLSDPNYLQRYTTHLPVVDFCDTVIWEHTLAAPKVTLTIDDTAYCIFTSGSSGKPKGVIMRHGSVFNLVKGLEKTVYANYEKGLRVSLVASYAFDASVQQIFGSLLSGNSLYIADELSRKDGQSLLRFYNENQITISDGTPTHLRMLLNSLEGGEELSYLKGWILAGEYLDKQLVSQFYDVFGKSTDIYNFYGPTETCVDSTYFKIDPSELSKYASIPIGKPLPNERAYVIDQYGGLTAPGVVGELCIAGAGLAVGYVGNPALTSDRFVNDWLAWEDRVYRTGDLVRWLPDGNLEYIGRMDDQVKLRGYRIELGEIANAVKSHSGVDDAVVLLNGEGEEDKRLTSYVVPSKENAYTVTQLIREEEAESELHAELYEMDNGVSMYFYNRSEADVLYTEIFKHKTYYKNGIKIPKNATIIDIGANVGAFSVFSMITFEAPKIYAFEPVSPIFDLLKKNTSLYQGDIKLFNIGISDKEEEAIFDYYPNATTLSGRHSDNYDIRQEVELFVGNNRKEEIQVLANGQMGELLEDRLSKESQICQLKSLSQVIKEEAINSIDLLKIDAENVEMDVINGIEAADWAKIKQIIVEVYDQDGRLDAIKEILHNRGFKVSAFQSTELNGTKFYDVYCTREIDIIEGRINEEYTSQHWYGTEALAASIKAKLSKALPDYMLPSEMILIDKIPLTTNGKLDQKVLKGLESRNSKKQDEPLNEMEKCLVEIWSEVLKLDPEKIGVTTDFFELGGHSLNGIQMANTINKRFGVSLKLMEIFKRRTIREISELIEMSKWLEEEKVDITTSARKETVI